MHAHQNRAKARHHELTRAAAQSRLAVQTRRRASHHQHAVVVGATATDPTFECPLTHEGDGLAGRPASAPSLLESSTIHKEGAMTHFRRIFAAVATLAGIMLAFAAEPAAFATRLPPPGGGGNGAQAPMRVIAGGGMPGWQITLIALTAALVGAAVAVLLDRARVTRRIHAHGT
jgi:hypothetical protein